MSRANREAFGVEAFAGHYESAKTGLPGASIGWVGELRERGIQAFSEAGLPNNRVEAWKYTNLRPLSRGGFVPSPANLPLPALSELPETLVEGSARLVLVNGRYTPELSTLPASQAGVTIGSVAALLDSVDPRLQGAIQQFNGRSPMASLNTALTEDGLLLAVEAGVEAGTPFELLHLAVGAEAPLAWHPRSVVVIGDQASAMLVERHISLGNTNYLANGQTIVTIGDGGRLSHTKVQRESADSTHIWTNSVAVAGDGRYENYVLTGGAALSRNEIDLTIDGSDVDVRLTGAYALAGNRHADHTSLIDHRAAASISRQVYKGVIDDSARGVFQGQIIVRREAQQTDGHQLNRALLLSDEAEIDSKPMLEIYADDVKCSHGATAGDIDANAMFYLMARGIPRATARHLLVQAFLRETLEEVTYDGLREVLSDQIDQILQGTAS